MLDLFSGCGGFTLGFVQAGCISVGGLESDPAAARTYSLNFHGDSTQHGQPRDITTTAPSELLVDLGLFKSEIDLIVGGPPCPAFARVGRAKLREILAHPEAFLHDPRARLYEAYLDYVRDLAPVAVVMENVPDILNWGGQNVGDVVASELAEMGYEPRYTLLNAVHFGVPQARDRFYLIAPHRLVGAQFEFPKPSHSFDLPRGYESSRTVALRLLSAESGSFSEDNPYFERPVQPSRRLRSAVTVSQAIGDLPAIDVNSDSYRKRGPRRVDEFVPYRTDLPLSAYARSIKNGKEGVTAHVTRCLTDRDHRIFDAMDAEEEYPSAKRKAIRLFEKKARRLRLVEGTSEWEALRRRYVPPYDADKYPNKWCKMASDKPARTLMAHLGKDSYSHIHYDQPRVLSVREAARLQSFPDSFVFHGRMNSAFRQVGNAVPPLMAKKLASALLQHLLAVAGRRRPAAGSRAAKGTT